jgi:hypothetical protein
MLSVNLTLYMLVAADTLSTSPIEGVKISFVKWLIV